MTARVRLLFFWPGKDDVGGGFIRKGILQKRSGVKSCFQVLFGSDPAKSSRADPYRWGAGTEVIRHKEAPSDPGQWRRHRLQRLFLGS